MTTNLAVVVLAGGLSTRFRSESSKLMHKLAGRPLLAWVLTAVRALDPLQIIVVYGQHNAEIIDHFQGVDWALQVEPKGTADALLSARTVLDPRAEHVLIISGDTPLIMPETLFGSLLAFDAAGDSGALVLTGTTPDPFGYGRIIRAGQKVHRIVEERDASPIEREIAEINSGIYVLSVQDLWKDLEAVGMENAKGEMYLTDLIGARHALIFPVDEFDEIVGINTRDELSRVEEQLQKRICRKLMMSGVSIMRPETCYFEIGVTIAPDTFIYPGTYLLGSTTVGQGCRIGPDSLIEDSSVGENCEITLSVVRRCRIGNRVKIGPYCNVRPETVLEDDVKLGDFVEIKKSHVGKGSKIPHLSYVGDAEVGEGVNVGAGTITCNYDGFKKHVTRIEDGVFIGSNSTIIAPRKIGKGSYVAAGSVVTEDVPPDGLAVGRARQVNKPGYAVRLKNVLAARKSLPDTDDAAGTQQDGELMAEDNDGS